MKNLLGFGPFLLAASAVAGPDFAPTVLELPPQRTGQAWARFDPDERLDLLISDDGGFRFHFQNPDGSFPAEPSQRIVDDVGGSIYDIADRDGDGVKELVALHRHSVDVYAWDPAAKAIVRRATPLIENLRGVEVQHPVPADVLFDIDGDGDEDLVYPTDGKYYVFFDRDGKFVQENQVGTKPVRVRMDTGKPTLRGEISGEVTIPRLQMGDLNGDGRLDLRATNDNVESFFLQSADGRIPETPTYEIDLTRFKREEPKREGGIKVSQFQFVPLHLNDDRIQDYVVVAGPKIWFYLSGPKGPNLDKPDQLLKVSTDYMSVAMLPIDDDPKPDLVVMKYSMPSLGRIVAGLAIGLNFEIEFLGYRNTGDPVVARRPDYRSVFVFKIPPIFRLLGEMEQLTTEFRGIRRRARSSCGGDFNGDGVRDFVKLGEKGLEFHFNESGREIKTDFFEEFGDAEVFRDLLFGEKRREVGIDTIFSFIEDVVGGFQEEAAAGRPPSLVVPLEGEIAARCLRMESRDLNGDGLSDPVVYLGPEDGKEYRLDEPQTARVFMSAR